MKDFCEQLFDYDIQKDEDVLKKQIMAERQEEETILMSEVRSTSKELMKNKTPGEDNAELIQNGREKTFRIIHKLCNQIQRSKQWPFQ